MLSGLDCIQMITCLDAQQGSHTSCSRTSHMSSWRMLGSAGSSSAHYVHMLCINFANQVIEPSRMALVNMHMLMSAGLTTFDSRLSSMSVTGLGRVSQSQAAVLFREPGTLTPPLRGCPLHLQPRYHNEPTGQVATGTMTLVLQYTKNRTSI